MAVKVTTLDLPNGQRGVDTPAEPKWRTLKISSGDVRFAIEKWPLTSGIFPFPKYPQIKHADVPSFSHKT